MIETQVLWCRFHMSLTIDVTVKMIGYRFISKVDENVIGKLNYVTYIK